MGLQSIADPKPPHFGEANVGSRALVKQTRELYVEEAEGVPKAVRNLPSHFERD